MGSDITAEDLTLQDNTVDNNTITVTEMIAKMTNPMTTQGDVIYGGASGLPTRLAKGTASQVLAMNAGATAPEWVAAAGGGDVTKVGTPVDNQVGVWTGDGTIEGTTGLTYDGSNFLLTGDIGITGTRITKGWFTDLEVTNAIAGSITGNAATVTTITGLAPDTATTQATQASITTCANLTTVGTVTTGNVDAVVSDANLTTKGKIEIATAAETTTGTDATRAVSPDGLAGSDYGIRLVSILVFNDSEDNATGNGAGDVFWAVPEELNGYNLVSVGGHLQTAGTTGTEDIQIHNVTQTADMLSTKITIDTTKKDSATAAAAPVIDAANDDVATGDEIRIDVDAIHTTAGKGLVVRMGFQLP